MNRSILRTLPLSLALLALCAGGAAAQNGGTQARTQRARVNHQQGLADLARTHNMNSYVRSCRNGVQRLYVHATQHGQAQALMNKYGAGSDVLQICHINRRGLSHSLAIFDGKLVHFQYRTGTSNWRLRNWGRGLRIGSDDLHTALIKLKPAEAQKLRDMLAATNTEQGPEHAAGRNWENGKVRNGMGNRHFNCTSVWTGAKIGQNGETLGQIVGLSASGAPRSFQASLEDRANDRVFGICVVGPQTLFGQNQDQNLFGR